MNTNASGVLGSVVVVVACLVASACRDVSGNDALPGTPTSIAWRQPTTTGAPLTRVGSVVLLRKPTGSLTAIDALSGQSRWSLSGDSISGALPGVDEFFISTSATRLVTRLAAVEAVSGQVRWQASSCNTATTRVGDVVISLASATAEWTAPFVLTARDARTGVPRWSTDVTALGVHCVAFEALAVRGDTVIFAAPAGASRSALQLVRVAASGHIAPVTLPVTVPVPAIQGSGWFSIQAAAAGTRVLVRDSTRLRMLDAATGSIAWSLDLRSIDATLAATAYVEQLIVSDDAVYVSAYDAPAAQIRALRLLLSTIDGRVIRREGDASSRLPQFARCGESSVMTRDTNGDLLSANWRTGAIVRRFPVALASGGGNGSIAEQFGRVPGSLHLIAIGDEWVGVVCE